MVPKAVFRSTHASEDTYISISTHKCTSTHSNEYVSTHAHTIFLDSL